jgi:uncharacterized membrane protein
MKKKIAVENKISPDYLILLILTLISVIPLLDLLSPGLPVTHDGQDHVARIANFYQNLKEGNIIPRWGANLNWGYGHPVLMFLYPLPSYVASLFHFIGFSLVDSTKIFFAISYIFSGLTMYLWLKQFLSRNAAYIGALLYLFAPYRFVDLYIRGAIGEHAAFIFPPLVLYSIIKLSKDKKLSLRPIIIGSLSLAALILSHNAISLMFLPLFLVYSLLLLLQANNKRQLIIKMISLFLIGFSLSAFFWGPAFFEGKYTLRDIVTKGEYKSRFSGINQLLYSPWVYGGSGEFSVQVGFIHILSVILSLPVLYHLVKKKDKLWSVGFVFLLFFIISLFLIEKSSIYLWERISLIQKFQFPWRFLSLSVFTSSVLGAILAHLTPKKYIFILLLFITIGQIIISKDFLKAKDYQIKPESFYTSIYNSTTDTGESSPVWSVRFMEKRPDFRIEVISGSARIKENLRKTTQHNYEIVSDKPVKIRENTLYFPGWKVYVDNIPAKVQFQDPANRGLMTFDLGQGVHNVSIRFEDTKLRMAANIVSLLFFSPILIILVYYVFHSLTSKSKKSKNTFIPKL